MGEVGLWLGWCCSLCRVPCTCGPESCLASPHFVSCELTDLAVVASVKREVSRRQERSWRDALVGGASEESRCERRVAVLPALPEVCPIQLRSHTGCEARCVNYWVIHFK